jgi:hypothetical protein
MPETPPELEDPYRALVLDVPGYTNGVFRVEDLQTCEELPPPLQSYRPPASSVQAAEAEEALDEVEVALLGNRVALESGARTKLHREFVRVTSHGAFAVYVRGK